MAESACISENDLNERQFIGNIVKKQTKYGSTSSNHLIKEKFFVHIVDESDTLAGLALRFNVSMEKIKRANNLWTSDSLFLHKTLNIPILSEVNVERTSIDTCPDEVNFLLPSSSSSSTSSTPITSPPSSTSEKSTRSSLPSNRLQQQLNSSASKNGDKKVEKILNGKQNANVLLASQFENGSQCNTQRADESAADFLIRIDSYIARSKDNFNTIIEKRVNHLDTTGNTKLSSTYSDDDLYKRKHCLSNGNSSKYRNGHNRGSVNSLNDYINDFPKPVVMTHTRKVKSSLKKLENKQDEFFEL